MGSARTRTVTIDVETLYTNDTCLFRELESPSVKSATALGLWFKQEHEGATKRDLGFPRVRVCAFLLSSPSQSWLLHVEGACFILSCSASASGWRDTPWKGRACCVAGPEIDWLTLVATTSLMKYALFPLFVRLAS